MRYVVCNVVYRRLAFIYNVIAQIDITYSVIPLDGHFFVDLPTIPTEKESMIPISDK